MSRTERPSNKSMTPGQVAGAVVGVLILLVAILVLGLLLREYGPGNMGNGFLQGAAVGLIACAVFAWRVSRGSGSTFERAWTQTGDERDDALLTRALAVVGLLALPLTAVATAVVGIGADPIIVLGGLAVAFAAILGVTFAILSRRG